MDAKEFNARLVAIGEKVKTRGWKGALIDIGISYLAMFDREQGPFDPVISYHPSIRATIHHSDRDGDWDDGRRGYNASESWGIKNIDEAIVKLEELAEKMPRMADESARVKAAKAKLSDGERRLLGIY